MDTQDRLFIINGEDKTKSVESIRSLNGRLMVRFVNSSREYPYRPDHVQVLTLQKTIDCKDKIVLVRNRPLPAVDRVQDFGPFFRILFRGGNDTVCTGKEIQLQESCLVQKHFSDLFEYFKATADVVGLKTDTGDNILTMQYKRIETVSPDTVLASYLDVARTAEVRTPPETLIYPFGLNQSQKVAVENAFLSQVSMIQGPPGTGKTQTILNIIANAVRHGKTVAVVSNNNSATQNVADKLKKKDLDFLTAFLGSTANKKKFLEQQSGVYPDMSDWALTDEEKTELDEEVTALSADLNQMLDHKNRIAAIEQELLQLEPEQHYFGEYYESYQDRAEGILEGLSSRKLLSLWTEYEDQITSGNKLGVLKKISLMFRYNIRALKIFSSRPEMIIPYLQKQFYTVRQAELIEERASLQRKLDSYDFAEKTEQLTEKSMKLFRCELSEAYCWNRSRRKFEKGDFRRHTEEFNREYPVILSTTYSIKGTLSFDHLYDYLIIDEASQVDLATGVLAFAAAKNVIIVGDLKQLPNVVDPKHRWAAEQIWKGNSFLPFYRYTEYSLLASASIRWKDAPSVLLREHYRCHPKIIDFCNQKFYDGRLVIMTEDHDEQDALCLYRTNRGNHARGHVNLRQIDVICQEVIPRLEQNGHRDIGVIAPYRDQVKALRDRLGDRYEVDTVHKFQGREKDAIVITSVDNVITDFVDDPRMLNVAVSRAVRALAVVTAQDPRNDRTNYGDLARYIAYHNCEVIDSRVYSVFDLLYQSYAPERRNFLKNHKRISEYESENLLYSVIEMLFNKPEFSGLRCAVHVSLSGLIRNYGLLTPEEREYAGNPLTHTDFLIYNSMDKLPILAIELDGVSFHQPDSLQAERDEKKNRVFEKIGIPLLRLRTDESGESERIAAALRKAELAGSCDDVEEDQN